MILGFPLFGLLGILLLILLTFQILTGKRILKVDFKYHRINGRLIYILALIHAFLAMGFYLGYINF